jgi:hypothetical protein
MRHILRLERTTLPLMALCLVLRLERMALPLTTTVICRIPPGEHLAIPHRAIYYLRLNEEVRLKKLYDFPASKIFRLNLLTVSKFSLKFSHALITTAFIPLFRQNGQ